MTQEICQVRERFRLQSALKRGAEPWVLPHKQAHVWAELMDRIRIVDSQGMRATVCVDLDLTSLLAPNKSSEVLTKLVHAIHELEAVVKSEAAQAMGRLRSIWCGEEESLLPGYTDTSMEAYGLYIVAQLQSRTGISLQRVIRDKCEDWIIRKVHAALRNDYWNRDLLQDNEAPGFAEWARVVRASGGEIVFLSNRDPSFRSVSLACLEQLLGGDKRPFSFFGPGGSAFDASSKAAAVALIEAGAPSDIYFGVARDGRTHFSSPSPDWQADRIVVAVIDDRAENRRQIIEAATLSQQFLCSVGLTGTMDIASAAWGFCPEIAVVRMPTVISSFEIQENSAR